MSENDGFYSTSLEPLELLFLRQRVLRFGLPRILLLRSEVVRDLDDGEVGEAMDEVVEPRRQKTEAGHGLAVIEEDSIPADK